MLELPVRLLHPHARPPARAYDGDAGFDLVSVEAAELAPGARASLGCGIAIELPEGSSVSCCRARGSRATTA